MNRYEIMIERLALENAVDIFRVFVFEIVDDRRSLAEIFEYDITSRDVIKGIIMSIETKFPMVRDFDFHFTHESDVDFGKARKWQTKLTKIISYLLIESVN